MEGRVERGWQAVGRAFEEVLASPGTRGAAAAVYHKGRLVVDVWGGVAVSDKAQPRPWHHHTLANVYSCSKGVSYFCVMLLVERGLVRYDEPVRKYWPEFAQHGKECITVGELLSHRGGLAFFEQTLPLDELVLYQQGKKDETFRSFLARQRPRWDRNSHGYHALTIGFYVSELIRSVDPKGRGLRDFFNEEVAIPYDIDFYFGIPETDDTADNSSAKRAVPYEVNRVARLYLSNTIPGERDMAFVGAMSDKQSDSFRSFDALHGFTPWRARYLEIGAAIGYSTATALAKLYSIIANKGMLVLPSGRSVQVLSPPVIEEAIALGVIGKDRILLKETRFTKGGFMRHADFKTAVYHSGMGGSIGWCDPAQDLSFSFIPNVLITNATEDDPRVSVLRDAIYAAASRSGGSQTTQKAAL